MLEKDKYKFFDTNSLSPTPGIAGRANEACIRHALEAMFPDDKFPEIKVVCNATGVYQGKASLFDRLWGSGKKITGLPKYYEVEIVHSTGKFQETLIVWSPEAWNDRFAGTAGGGTGIGGRGYLTMPDNTTRGWTVPYAVMNGFTAATMYAGNIEGWHDYTLDYKTGKFNRELYENWRVRSTHNMTVFGRAVAEILHDRPVKYTYMNGGSGGGRQSLMEVQNYPHDYDGVWASCPAINWNHFLLGGFWPQIVMKEQNHFLNAKKNQYFIDQVHATCGGKDKYYKLRKIPEIDARRFVGQKSPGGVITEADAAVMNEIWHGPHKRDKTALWYGYYPGVKNWQSVIPIGTYYYPLFSKKKIKPFILGPLYARWITENPKDDFKDMDAAAFEKLFDTGAFKFADNLGDDPAIDAFVNHGGKLMMDHGMDDPLIPVQGTMDYYEKLCTHFGGKENVDKFCRFYCTPGDNHGNCQGNGPGLTQSAGIQALMDWVEKGIAPGTLRKVRVHPKTGELLEEGMEEPV